MQCPSCPPGKVCNPLTGRCRKCQSLEKLTVRELAELVGVNSRGTKRDLCARILPKRNMIRLPPRVGLVPVLESSLDKRDELTTQLEALTTSLQTQEQEKQKLASELNAVSQTLRKLQAEAKKPLSAEQRAELQQETEKLQQQKRQFETILQQTQAEKQTLQEQVQATEIQLRTQETQLREAQTSLLELGAAREVLERQLKQQEQEKQQAEQELRAKSQELGTKGEEYVQLLEDKSVLEAGQLAFQEKLDEARENLAQQRQEYDAFVKKSAEDKKLSAEDLEIQKAKRKQFETELKQAKQLETTTRKELEETKQAVGKVTKQVEKQEAEFTLAKQDLIQKAKEAQAETLKLKQELATRDAQLTALAQTDLSCAKIKDLKITQSLKSLLEALCVSVPPTRPAITPTVPQRGVQTRAQRKLESKQPSTAQPTMQQMIAQRKREREGKEAKATEEAEARKKIALVDEKKRKERARKLKEEKERKGRIGVNVRIRPLFEKRGEKQADLQFEQGGNELTVPYLDRKSPTSYQVSGEVFSDDVALQQGSNIAPFEIEVGPDAKIDGRPSEQFYQVAAKEDVEAYVKNQQTAAIFAYGPSGTGKTLTMNYITQKALKELLNSKEGKKNGVHVAFVDIYKNKIADLLKTGAKDLKLPTKFSDLKLTFKPVTTVEEYFKLYNDLQRVVAMTEANDQSSRSHLLTLLTTDEDPSKTTNLLALVDLAGSEDLTKLTPTQLTALGYAKVSVAKRAQLLQSLKEESQAINTSLTGLTNLFETVGREIKQGKRPSRIDGKWRNDSLVQVARLLVKPNTRVSLITALSPSEKDLPQTHKSMDFAQKASDIELGGASPKK